MSLTVSCRDCVHPSNPRQVVQWRMGSCRECCDDLVARHKAEFPDHKIEISGFESSTRTPFGNSESTQRLLGSRRTA